MNEHTYILHTFVNEIENDKHQKQKEREQKNYTYRVYTSLYCIKRNWAP